MDGVRLSQLAKCSRMAAYGALGTLTDELPYDPEESWFRGKVYEAVAALRAGSEWGTEYDGQPNIERQRVVPWPLGEGHADVFVRSERLLIECKSSVSDSDIPLVDGMRQLQLYVHFDPEAVAGELWFFDPRKGAFKPLRIRAEAMDVATAERLVDNVRQAMDGGDLPPRVCSHPKMGPEHLCPFVETCFDGWVEPVARIERDAESEVEALAMEWLDLKLRETEKLTNAKGYHERRKEVEERLRALVPAGKSEVEGYTLNRIQVGESYSLPLKKAMSMGLWTDAHNEQFGQLISRRKGHERFQIAPTGDDETVAEVDDAGDVPF